MDTNNMSVDEIKTALGSNKYIPSTIKKRMQERLNNLSGNIYSVLDDPNISAQNFPTLTNSSKIKSSALSFNKFITKTDTEQNTDMTKISVLDDNIEFKSLLKIYTDSAIFRIYMQYVGLNRKIHIIHRISDEKNINFENIAKVCNFTNIIFLELTARTCLEIFFEIKNLINEINNFLQLCTSDAFDSELVNIFLTKINTYVSNEKIFINQFSKYKNIYVSNMNILIKIINKIINTGQISDFENVKHNIKSVINSLDKNILLTILDEISTITNIKCDYFIGLDPLNNIVLQKIYRYIYVDCTDEFILSKKILDTHNVELDKDILSKITAEELMKYFESDFDIDYFTSIKTMANDISKFKFIKIKIFKPKQLFFDIYHNIDIDFKILNVPSDTKILCSKSNVKSKENSINISHDFIPKINPWLLTRTRDDIFRNEFDEQSVLSNISSSNGYHVDYLYDRLTEHSNIDIPSIESFRDLAYDNSEI